MDAFLAALDEPAGTSWSRASSWHDRLVIALTIGLAALTLWFASAPVLSTGRFYLLAILWPVMAMAWAVSLIGSVRRGTSLAAAMVLFVGASATIGGSIPIVLGVLFGSGAALGALAAGLGLLGLILVRERPRRIVWVVAPAIVVATFGLAFSGLPRLARFTIAEPALTAYAGEVLEQTPAARPGGRDVIVGEINVRRTYVRHGCVHLVTAGVGVLGDSPGGIAHCPNGPPIARFPYEPFAGPWYRW